MFIIYLCPRYRDGERFGLIADSPYADGWALGANGCVWFVPTSPEDL